MPTKKASKKISPAQASMLGKYLKGKPMTKKTNFAMGKPAAPAMVADPDNDGM